MREGFSFSREFDFVRLGGLRRATGRPPHEWDIYIIKELIDNALDADDGLWQKGDIGSPVINIEIEYVHVPEKQSDEFYVQQSNQFYVQVSNVAPFPIHQIRQIFDTQWYTSRKAFIKGLNRGALGNALKTVLGIPYALRNREVGNWNPDVNPMSISCGGKEYLPHFVIDSMTQTIKVECEEKESEMVEGTRINVGMWHFEQEVPRRIEDIQNLAANYHLCNPHAQFTWTVEIDEQEWQVEYIGSTAWKGKYRKIPPVQWYSQTAFRDLLSALYRKHCSETRNCTLPVSIVSDQFYGHSLTGSGNQQYRRQVEKVLGSWRIRQIAPKDIEGDIAIRLYRLLKQHSPNFKSSQLGALGYEHVNTTLRQVLSTTDEIIYNVATDDGYDPSTPFVIEAALAPLSGGKRQVLTAINFTPTYNDPFLSRKLLAPIIPEESVLGLRGILDAYNLTEDASLALFVHLICPNIEHHEFSKTEINHLPFINVLGKLLDYLFKEFRDKREAKDRRIEQSIFQILDSILDELGEAEKFVFEQLIEKLRARLSQDQTLAAWLETPDALTHLQTHINTYQSRNAILSHRVARPAAGLLSLPLHPQGHFTISTDHISRELLARHYVNKILYINVRELEPVVLDNNWLCKMDMAMISSSATRDGLQEALAQCIINTDLVLMILHNADEKSRSDIEEIRLWLSNRQLDSSRIFDLGLDNANDTPTKLIEMMPNELATWMMGRLKYLGIPTKSMPSDLEVRRDIREKFENMLLGHIWEGISQQMHVTQLVDDLDEQFNFTKTMSERALDVHLRDCLEHNVSAESYTTILDKVVGEFFASFMADNDAAIHENVERHLMRVEGG